ncbi:MAG: uroporphyrinogen decarboxylase family protein [Candidatus Omnitrophota bacterium]
MTKREWIQAMLEGRKDIPVPQHWMSFFNSDLARRLSPEPCHYSPMWIYDVPDRFDSSAMGADNLDRLIRFNNHTGRCFSCLGKGANICFGHGGPGEFFCRSIKRDENELVVEYETGVRAKVQFHPHFYHHYDHPVKCREDLQRLELPDPAAPERYAGFTQDAAYLKSKGEYVLGSLNGFFSGLHYFLMEYSETLMNLILEPNLIHELAERLGEWNLTAARKMIEAGADCIALCDDLGTKKSLLMKREHYRTFFQPWHMKLCNAVHDLGGRVHCHSHGAITAILDDLAECGFDFINPFDPEEGHTIEHVMKTYSDRFIVTGGFPASFWNWEADRQNVFLHEMGRLGQRYGRLIFMDSGGVPDDVSPQDFERITRKSRQARGVEDVEGAV